MKKIIIFCLLATALAFSQNPPPNQAAPIIVVQSFSAIGAGNWITTGPGVTVNSLSWASNSMAALTGCSVELEGSPDQIHVSSTLIISPQNCGATPASFTSTGISANYVRIRLVGLTTGNVGVTYTGTVTGTVSSGSSGPPGSVSWGEILGTLSDQTDLAVALNAKAPNNSPALTGVPTVPTPATNDNSTTIVNSAWVRAQGYGTGGSSVWGSITGTLSNQTDLQAALDAKAPLASPAFSGNPTVPTQSTGNNSTRAANTTFVQNQIIASAPGLAPVQSVAGRTGVIVIGESDVVNLTADLALKAPLNSPTLTGNPTAPTPLTADSSLALATTQFVKNQGYLTLSSVSINNSLVNSPNFNAALPTAEASFVNVKWQFTGSSVSGEIPTGTSGVTVAAGNDSRIVGAEQLVNKNSASGYAGLDAFSKLSGTQQLYGTASNTAAQGNDSRIVNATPNSRTVNTVNSLAGGGDLTQDRSLQLVNDSPAPGNTKYYGTNSSGVKGWFDLAISGSGILNLQTLTAGTQFITATGDANLNFAENSSGATHAFTISLIGTIPKARLGTAVFNDQANAFSTGLQDFTNAILQVPSSSGAAPTLNARIAYDTASNTYKGGVNGTSQQFVTTGGDIAFTTAFQVVNLHLTSTTPCGPGLASRGIDANGNGFGCFTPTGSGNVTGPVSSVADELAGFNGTSGTILKSVGIASANVVTEAVAASGAGFLIQSAGVSKVVSTTTIATTSIPVTCTNSDPSLQCNIAANTINLTWGTPIVAAHLNPNVVQSFSNDPNITFVIAAQNATVTMVGNLPKARLLGTVVYTDQGNAYSTGTQDFTSAGALLVPAGAGLAPTASKSVAYDTTANAYKVGVNGVGHTLAYLDSNISGTAALATALAVNPSPCATSPQQYVNDLDANGTLHCSQVTYASVSGTPTLAYQLVGSGGTSQTARNRINFIQGSNFTLTVADNAGTNSTDITLASTAGGLTNPMLNPFDMIRAGAAGLPTNLPGVTTYDGVAQMLVEVSTAGAASSLGWSPAGVPVSTLSSNTPVILYTHRANLVLTSNTTAFTSTSIAAAGSSQFDLGFPIVTCNTGTVVNTITPATTPINTNSTLKLLPGFTAASGNNPECAFIWSDNSNYYASVIVPTDSNGRLHSNAFPAMTGDVTNAAGSLSTTVGKVNNGAIPANAGLVGTNVGGQFISVSVVPTSAIPAFTGDVSNSAGSLTMTLATTAVTAASYTYGAFTVDAKGRLTAASNGAAPVILNAANSMGSSFTADMSAASTIAGLIVPKAAGAIPVNDGVIAENTTNHTLVHGFNGTTTLVSAVAATGTGTATACTNQVVISVSGIAVPGCATVIATMTDTSIAHTGVDVNTSYQVTVTHLASALPFAQGGFGTATAVSGGIPYGSSTSAVAFSAVLAANYPVTGGGAGAAPATVSLAEGTLTDGATVTWAIASAWASNSVLTFTTHGGSRTLNLTNPLAGATYVLRLVQDATGGENLTLGTGCTWKVSGSGAGAITLSTGANAVDILAFYYNGTNCYANLNKAFS